MTAAMLMLAAGAVADPHAVYVTEAAQGDVAHLIDEPPDYDVVVIDGFLCMQKNVLIPSAQFRMVPGHDFLGGDFE